MISDVAPRLTFQWAQACPISTAMYRYPEKPWVMGVVMLHMEDGTKRPCLQVRFRQSGNETDFWPLSELGTAYTLETAE